MNDTTQTLSAGATSIDEGMSPEAQAELLASARARALSHVARAEQLAMAAGDESAAAASRCIERVAVIGAGTMGVGIAMNFANAGMPVVLLEAQAAALDKGMRNVAASYASSVAKGRLSQAQADERIARITPSLSYAALAEVDLVIEAVFEQLDVKEAVLRRIDEALRPGAVIASNTSGLDLDVLAGFTRRPADVIGMHFFSPAHVMRLLEVVRGRDTAPDVLNSVMALARRIGKTAVVAGVCDGFIGNRMLARYVAAADGLVRQGALPQEVDAALEAFGFAMGPFRMGDLAGLDIAQAGRKRRAAHSPGRSDSLVADALCDVGRFGEKTGAGWYRYEPGQRKAMPDPQVEVLLSTWRRERGIEAKDVSAADIVERCVLALVNEGARIVDEGIAQRASDIDVVYVNGYGFPAHRGGPMHHAQELGLPQVVEALARLAAEPGSDPSWEPAELLRRLAVEGKTFPA